jgi:hypothetical protein
MKCKLTTKTMTSWSQGCLTSSFIPQARQIMYVSPRYNYMDVCVGRGGGGGNTNILRKAACCTVLFIYIHR